jgi:dihydroflavonol-4-reductase
MAGADAVFHVAGDYRIGIPAGERPAMYASNVDGTRAVLEAAAAAGIRRVVHVSTANVFGNTRGRVVDETYRRPDRTFLSYYDETKFLAHELAEERAAAGLPVVIACSGGVYGPGDHSEVGRQIEQAAAGGYRVRAFPGLGMSLAYVDDTAAGLLLAHDAGRTGETYILGGENVTLGHVLELTARACGYRVPRLTLPPLVLRALVPLGRWAGPWFGVGPDLAEVIRASDGVTYWVSSEKARRELGYRPRDLVSGLAQLLASRRPGAP